MIQIGDMVATVGYKHDSIGTIVGQNGVDLWLVSWYSGNLVTYNTSDIYWLKDGWERLQNIGKCNIN